MAQRLLLQYLKMKFLSARKSKKIKYRSLCHWPFLQPNCNAMASRQFLYVCLEGWAQPPLSSKWQSQGHFPYWFHAFESSENCFTCKYNLLSNKCVLCCRANIKIATGSQTIHFCLQHKLCAVFLGVPLWLSMFWEEAIHHWPWRWLLNVQDFQDICQWCSRCVPVCNW